MITAIVICHVIGADAKTLEEGMVVGLPIKGSNLGIPNGLGAVGSFPHFSSAVTVTGVESTMEINGDGSAVVWVLLQVFVIVAHPLGERCREQLLLEHVNAENANHLKKHVPSLSVLIRAGKHLPIGFCSRYLP